MLKALSFLWNARHRRFVHALSHLEGRQEGDLPGGAVWALYQLGMYRTVVRESVGSHERRATFARAVSLAACGDVSAARQEVQLYRRKRGSRRERISLATALAPYLPLEAASLIDDLPAVAPGFRVAIMLASHQHSNAASMLGSLSAAEFSADPELHLLENNVFGGSSLEQLARLNAYLKAHGLSSVRLVDELRMPSPRNLIAEVSAANVQGPLVTVLMTTYCTGERVVAAIESILSQSYRNIQLIVVDDASSDETPERVQEVASRDARLCLVRLPRNVGTYAAKLIGLMRAEGEFVTCHDSDDWAHPRKLELQVLPLLKDRRLVGSASCMVRMQDDGVFYARAVYPVRRLNQSSLLFRRDEVLRSAGVWDCVRIGADTELLARIRLIFGLHSVLKVPLPLTLGSHRSGSLMTGKDTGYSAVGVSPVRLEYCEAYSRWHIRTVGQGGKPQLPRDLRHVVCRRAFPVPESIQVSASEVQFCLDSLGDDFSAGML